MFVLSATMPTVLILTMVFKTENKRGGLCLRRDNVISDVGVSRVKPYQYILDHSTRHDPNCCGRVGGVASAREESLRRRCLNGEYHKPRKHYSK